MLLDSFSFRGVTDLLQGTSNAPTGDFVPTPCTDKWKAAQDDSKKKAFDGYDETGIFVAVCQHGFLITMCDMVKSGEL